MGLRRAGADVIGVDVEVQPRYPFPFIQGDALRPPVDLSRFDLVWASPHCQRYTSLGTREDLSAYPDQIPALREMLAGCGAHYVIENVVGAPLRVDLTLCANAFGLRS